MRNLDLILKVIISLVVLITPLFYFVGYLYRYGWLSNFGIAAEKYPLSFHEYVANGSIKFFEKLMYFIENPWWMIGICLLFIVFLLIYLSMERIERSLRRLVVRNKRVSLWEKKFLYWFFRKFQRQRDSDGLENKINTIDFSFKVLLSTAIFFPVVIIIFMILVYVFYLDGVQDAKNILADIKEDEYFNSVERKATVCVDKKEIFRGYLLLTHPSGFVIYSNSRVHELMNSDGMVLITNIWEK